MTKHTFTRRSFLKRSVAASSAAALSWSSWHGWMASGQPVPLKIGVVSQFTGPPFIGLTEDMVNGFNLAIEQAGGQAAGRSFELIEADTEVNPQRGLEVTQKVLEQDQVDIIIGPISSGVAGAMRDTVAAADVLWLISNAGNVLLTGERCAANIFRTSFSSWQTAFPFGPWAFDNVAQEYFLAFSNFAFGQQSAQFFTESFTARGGTILGEVAPPLRTSDFSSFFPAIQSANPPAVFAFFSGSDAVNFVNQYAQFGLKNQIPLTGNGFMVEEDVLPAQGENALGIKTLLYWALSLDNPANNAFKETYAAKFGEEPSVFSVQGFDTANVILDVVTRLDGNFDSRKNLDEIIRATEGTLLDNSPRGTTFRFDKDTHNVILNMFVREVQEVNGRITNVVIDELGEAIQPPLGCSL